MSWYVETLLIDSEHIRSDVIKRVSEYGDRVYVDLNGNDYNNLLVLEKTIKDLHKSGHISDREVEVISLVSTAKSLRELEKENVLARHSLAKVFYNVCEKLAFILGGEFTDEGYLAYMKVKHKLDDEQLEQVREYMAKGSLNQTRRIY
jgi:hypothetical protein